LVNEIPKFTDVHNPERQFGRKFQKPKEMQRVPRMGFGFFRQPVVHSGDVAHRLAAPPQPIPSLATESLVAPASPSLMKDAFSIDDNTRNTI
jgi:hypothetical protein